MLIFTFILVLLTKNILYDREQLLSPRTFFLLGFLWFLGFGFLFIDPLAESDILPSVMLWTGAGLVAFELGSWTKRAPSQLIRILRLGVQIDPTRSFLAALSISATGAAIISLLAASSGISRFNYVISLRSLQIDAGHSIESYLAISRYFGWAQYLGIAGGIFAFYLLLWTRGNIGQRLVLMLLMIAAVPMSISGGARFPLLQYVLTLAILYYQYQRWWNSASLKKYLVAALCGIFALIGISVISELRSSGGLSRIEESKTGFFDIANLAHGTGALGSTLDAFRFFPDRRNFLLGSTFIFLPVSFIPRVWWPEKPIALGIIMANLRGSYAYSEAISTIGELYANFGVIGIPIGMFIYGRLCQWLYLIYRSNMTHLPFVLLYTYALPFFFMHVRGEFGTVWFHYFTNAIPLYLALRFSRPKPIRYVPSSLDKLRRPWSSTGVIQR